MHKPMMPNSLVSAGSAVALCCGATVAQPTAVFYNSSIFQPGGDDHLYQVDLSTGAVTDVGWIGAGNVEAIDVLPDGRVIGVDGFLDDVWDLTVPPGQLIGQTGARFGVDAGLSYDPTTGKLFNLNGADSFDITHSWFYEVNPDTGAATFVSQNTNIYADSLAINDDGQAYAADNVFTDRFFSVNVQTGAMVVVGNLNIPSQTQVSMDFDCEGTLWARTASSTTNPDEIYTINTATGNATWVATMDTTSAGFRGLAIVSGAAACTCAADLDGDAVVGITDFLQLLAEWGTDPGGPPDFDGDGNVGIADFLALLANWGPCP